MNKQKRFIDVYNEFIVFAEKRHKKQGFDKLIDNFKLHILPYFENYEISKLNEADIVSWQTNILDKKFSNSFNNSLYYNFSEFIKFCIIYKYLDYNVVIKAGKFPKRVESKEHSVYNIFEFIWFKVHLKNYVIKQFFNFMFNYGTRPSEAMALRFCDYRKSKLKIIHSIQRRGKRELDTPKNSSSIRTLRLSPLCRFRFWRLKNHYIKKYGDFNENYFIFGGRKPLSTTTIDRYKKQACQKANMHEITQHEFRHSYATRKIHSHIPIDVVSRNLGHSKVSTTVDIYLHQEKRVSDTLFSRFNF